MDRVGASLGLVALTTLSAGCVVTEYGAAGVATAASERPGRTGFAFDFVGGVGRLGPESPLSLTAGSHMMVTENVSEVAPSLALEASPRPIAGRLVPFVDLGVRPFALGFADGRPGRLGGRDFSFSVVSPQAAAGLMILVVREEEPKLRIVSGWTVVLRGSAQYDLRVTEQPNELYLSATLGPGFYFSIL